jgi:hypothetical protein
MHLIPAMTRYTSHEVAAPREVGPSGRTVSLNKS